MSPRELGVGLAILAILGAVMGLLKLWDNARTHRIEMDLMDEWTKEMQTLAAEARAQKTVCPECKQLPGKHKLDCNRGRRLMPETLH